MNQNRLANPEGMDIEYDNVRAPHVAASDLSDRQINRLLDADVVGAMITDAAGRVYEANDAFLEMHGYTRDDLIAQKVNWLALTPADWKPRAAAVVAEFKRDTISYRKEHFHKDGHRISLSLGATRIRGTGLALCTLVNISPVSPARTINPQIAFFAAKERFGLTNREHEVLSYLLEGLTNAEMATVLVICASTVTDHVQSIMRKVGVQKRSQLFKRVILG